MLAGVALGWLNPRLGADMKPLGDGFIALVRMIIGPVIFCTVVNGVGAANDFKKVGRVALKALVYFEVVTLIALVFALVGVNLWGPGVGMNVDLKTVDAHSVAEYATCAAMLLLRGAFQATHATAAGTWQKVKLSGGFETSGKILGVVGFGTIGRMTARMAAGLGMQVIGYDPAVAAGDPAWNAHGATLVSFETLLASADVVTLHVPLEAGTRSLFDAARLAQMKKGAMLINTSRGGIVDESALADALISGHIGGAAIDVFAVEPLPAGSALARAVEAGVPNLVLTPHIAGLSAEANTRVSGMIAAKVAGFLDRHG